ncbi:MAG: GGDEF-domain containing protein [Tardiphaga sp.]|nr:GGDEF-domain containing protein [Tardiphaga sp.]
MRRRLFGRGLGGRLHETEADTTGITDLDAPARRNPIRWLIVCGAVLIAGIVIGIAMMVGNFRERALHSGERELENTVLLLARHYDRQLEDFEAIQKTVGQQASAGINSADAFARRMSGEDTHLMLKAKITGTSDVAGVNLFNADGVLINTSEVWPAPTVNIVDRTFFKTFKSGPASTATMIEMVRGRFNGQWAIVIARRISGENGEFLGVITRAVVPETIENFFASVALGQSAAITIFHNDGTMLARYPHAAGMIGKPFPIDPLFSQKGPPADHGTIRLTSPIDGNDKLASGRRLSNYPLSILATMTISAALADWYGQTRLLIGVAALSALVITIILFFIVRQLTQQHEAAQRRLALEKRRLDTAVNNMTQGLLLFDSEQRLVISNQRYIEMFGVSPDVVKPGLTIQGLLQHRKETGTFTGNIDEYCAIFLARMAKGEIYQTVLDTAGGRSVQVLYRPLADGGWVTTLEDTTERRRAEERIAHMAHYDALTGLPNRVLFRDLLEKELEKTRHGEQFAVLYIDIDEFKSVNDSLGHPVGDELLKAVASRLSDCVRQTDFVARLGGDEFAVVQTDIRHPADVKALVTSLYQAIREPYECLGHRLVTDASIGIALAPQDGTDLDQLLKNADLAMYGAKGDGRRTYRFFEPNMDAHVKERRTLELDLRQAVTDGEFELYYQPVVDLRSNDISGCEALLRWRHPVRGMISPEEFIPVAEETGLIGQLGEWVINTACAEAVTWPDDIRIAVNISPVQFRSHTLALKVAAALAASGLPASRLELEITETVLIRDDAAALATLHQLRAIGVRIALDDFGTGYSSLSYLQRFPFDKIKIDRCFVNEIAEADGSSSIVQAVVNIAKARNMTTTAEGVETEQQKQLLHSLGCTEMQGFLFSPPRPADDIRRLYFARHKGAAAVRSLSGVSRG